MLVEAATHGGGLDAAVLDMMLAGESASPVADRLAALGVPFVFSTGYGVACDRGRYQAVPLLAKPFGLDRLVATVSGLGVRRAPITAA